MEIKQEIKQEIFQLVVEAVEIITLRENEIFVIEDALGNVKIFNFFTKELSNWLYSDKFEKVTDNLLLLQCQFLGDRFFHLDNFKLSKRFSSYNTIGKKDLLLLQHRKNSKFKLLHSVSFLSTEWLVDFDFFDENEGKIHLKDKSYLFLDENTMETSACMQACIS